MADVAAISVYVRRAAGEAGIQAVINYASDRGFRIMPVPARHCVILRGPHDALSAAFPAVPAALALRVEAVLGLEPGPALRPGIATAAGTGHKLAELAASLHLPDGDGAGHCLGLLSFNGGVDHAALAAACKAHHIPVPTPAPHVMAVDGASPMPGAHDGPLLTMLLVLAALVPKAKLVVYVAPATARGWVDALSSAIHDTDNRPSVVCNAWLPPEPCPIAAELAQQAVALRVALFQAVAHSGTHKRVSGTGKTVWTGSGIDAVIEAAARLRAMPAPAAAQTFPLASPPPSRPHFDATTLSTKPGAEMQRAKIAFETDPYPGDCGDGTLSAPWALLPGSMATDIAAGADGSLWALSATPVVGGFALFHLTALGWRAADAGGMALAVDAQGLPWVVDAYGTLMRFTGTDWRVVRDGLHDVAIAPDGAVWALSDTSTADGRAVLHRAAPAHGEDAPEWTEDTMHAERIAVAPDGTAWVVTKTGEAMRRDGAAWAQQAINVHDVAVDGHGRVWVVSRQGRRLYCRARQADGWVRGDGVADRVVPQPGGLLWAVTPQGFVAAARVSLQIGGKAA
jgi:hypothetical protein